MRLVSRTTKSLHSKMVRNLEPTGDPHIHSVLLRTLLREMIGKTLITGAVIQKAYDGVSEKSPYAGECVASTTSVVPSSADCSYTSSSSRSVRDTSGLFEFVDKFGSSAVCVMCSPCYLLKSVEPCDSFPIQP